MDSDQTEQKSFRKVAIIITIVVVFFAVLGVVVYALLNSTAKQEEAASTTNSPAPWPRIATKEQIQKDITELNDQLKQAAADQAAATAILKESEKQKKVGN